MSLKTKLDAIGTTTIVLCAVAVTLLWGRREFIKPVNMHATKAPALVKDWKEYAVGNKRIGPESAAVTIVEFSDFQCPYCQQLAASLQSIRATYPMDVAVVYRNFPMLRLHPQAQPAAIAAECAAAQGRFPEYHDLLFQQQDSLAGIDWVNSAERAGVADTSTFHRCLTGAAVTSTIRADSVAGMKLGVVGTPTVLVNGWRLVGTPSEQDLKLLIDKELKK